MDRAVLPIGQRKKSASCKFMSIFMAAQKLISNSTLSVAGSTFAVASSISIILVFLTKALARQISCLAHGQTGLGKFAIESIWELTYNFRNSTNCNISQIFSSEDSLDGSSTESLKIKGFRMMDKAPRRVFSETVSVSSH